MDHKDLCEHTRIRLIAAAAGHQQCTKTESNIIPLPGTDRVIVIGTPAQVRALLEDSLAAPASAQPDHGAARGDETNHYDEVTVALGLLRQDYSPECLKMATTPEYVEDAVSQLISAGYRLVAASPSSQPVAPKVAQADDLRDAYHADYHYTLGLRAGWNLSQQRDVAGFNAALASRQISLDAAKAELRGEAHAQQEAAPARSVAKVRVTNGGYAMELATYIAYALPEGEHELFAAPTTVPDHSERGAANAGGLDTVSAILRDVCELDYSGEDWDHEKMLSVTVDDLRLICGRHVRAAGQEAANAKDAWINVKDRLPEPWRGRLFSESVLVVDMDSRYPHVRMTELNFEEYEGKIVPTVWSGADPTHWRPAPALPAAMAAAPSSEKGGA